MTDFSHFRSHIETHATTTASEATTSTLAHGVTAAHSPAQRVGYAALRIGAFAALLCAAAMVGRIQVPGTEVGITLQTFVLMIAGLTLTPVEAGSAAALYLVIGAAGAPVFSGGASAAALVGPSAGFLFGFVPAVIVAALLKAPTRGNDSDNHLTRALMRNLVACTAGCILVPYLIGVSVQAAITGTDIRTLAAASAVFFIGDAIKALVATATVTPARVFSARRAQASAASLHN
ncbi:MAG: biotin transporter BioY [Bifidobacteriaceae bacterium]|nr:biotin transporter BioY [Bifidobacteriaceae bacterium]